MSIQFNDLITVNDLISNQPTIVSSSYYQISSYSQSGKKMAVLKTRGEKRMINFSKPTIYLVLKIVNTLL